MNPPIHEDDPQCGWYRRRTSKGGHWVPARIWLHQVLDHTGQLTEPEVMLCEVNGRELGAIHEWTWLAKNPISREQYQAMVDEIAYAGSMDPSAPILSPETPVDLVARPTAPGVR